MNNLTIQEPLPIHEDCGGETCCHAQHLESGLWVENALDHPNVYSCCADELPYRLHCKEHKRGLEEIVGGGLGCVDCGPLSPMGIPPMKKAVYIGTQDELGITDIELKK